MSEYWVSKKKYFCKYCDIYIADDAPSRRQHENGLRHQGNKDRFIRGLYKTGEKKKKDAEEEKREMARIEMAAQAAFAQDVGSGHAKPTPPPVPSSSTASSSSTRKPAAKPSNPYANYSTAQSLGYTDPDVERLAAEAERHRTQGVAGDWQVVEQAPAVSTEAEEDETDAQVGEKRPAAVEEDSRAFKIQKRKLAAGLGHIYDPGPIQIKLKPKLEMSEQDVKVEEASASTSVLPVASEDSKMGDGAPKWTSRSWKQSNRVEEQEPFIPEPVPLKSEPEEDVKPIVDAHAVSHSPPLEAAKLEPPQEETAPAGNMFRKRKPKGPPPARRAMA